MEGRSLLEMFINHRIAPNLNHTKTIGFHRHLIVCHCKINRESQHHVPVDLLLLIKEMENLHLEVGELFHQEMGLINKHLQIGLHNYQLPKLCPNLLEIELLLKEIGTNLQEIELHPKLIDHLFQEMEFRLKETDLHLKEIEILPKEIEVLLKEIGIPLKETGIPL